MLRSRLIGADVGRHGRKAFALPFRPMLVLSFLAMLGGCAGWFDGVVSPSSRSSALPSSSPSTAAAAPAPTVEEQEAIPFDEAVLRAASRLLAEAERYRASTDPASPRTIVIDPLIDGVTGVQSIATRSMESRIVELVQKDHPRLRVEPFNTANLNKAPLVLLGSFTRVDARGDATGSGDRFRIWLVLADLKAGMIVARGTARARTEGVDTTPTRYFADSPAWTDDRSIKGYLATCEAEVGEPISRTYLDGILAAALINEAIQAYEAGRYDEALNLYTAASRTENGDQLRVHNGLYLTNWQLGRREAAAEAFGEVVDLGLRQDRLAVKLLFKPGSTTYWPDPKVTEPYPMWLEQVARRTARSGMCLEVSGHTSPTGSPMLNDRLSRLRAEHIRDQLIEEMPGLDNRVMAKGYGSRNTLVGTGRDDVTDALDRRVEFRPMACDDLREAPVSL